MGGRGHRAFFGWLALALSAFPAGAPAVEWTELRVGSHAFRVEVARSPAERARGLMFRKSLPADGGMLLLFPTEQPTSIWMKNTPIPLDLLFLKGDGTVGLVAPRRPALSTRTVSSAGPVRAVLELNGGTAERLGIREGDRVTGGVFEVPAP